METKWKDVCHLYNNPFNPIQVLVDEKDVRYLREITVSKSEKSCFVFISCATQPFDKVTEDEGWMPLNDDETLSRIKPILRPLNDMTESELLELGKITMPGVDIPKDDLARALKTVNRDGINAFEADDRVSMTQYFEVTRYLLSKHFDLFSLIPNGYAIYRTTLPSLTNNKI